MTSTQLSGAVVVAAQGLYKSSSDQLHAHGELVFTNDGRAFRYAEAGATALVSGSLYQMKVENTSDQNLACAAAATAAIEVVTTSTVTVDANEYANGYLVVTVTPGLGKVYKIASHPAASAAALTITLADPLETNITTTSRIDLVANPYKDVIINPATATSAPAGVAVCAVAADEFGWLGVSGPQPCLAAGALTVGSAVIASTSTAGAVSVATGSGGAPIGTALSGVATTEVGLVQLNLL